MKRLLLVLAAFVAAVAAMTTGATASTSTTVSFFDCTNYDNGQVTVPAGSTVTMQGGWVTKYLGQEYAFLQDVTVTASVNGTPITNTNSYWSAPEVFPLGGWVTWWTYPTGITLDAGQSLTFTTDWVLAHPLSNVGFGPPNVVPAGDLIGTRTCTVTGT